MATIVDIEKAEERATRALDGMTYNRDQMARDVIGMAAELRNWRAAFERAKTSRKGGEKFSDFYRDLFGEAFDRKQ